LYRSLFDQKKLAFFRAIPYIYMLPARLLCRRNTHKPVFHPAAKGVKP
jgi:hypothetical protein